MITQKSVFIWLVVLLLVLALTGCAISMEGAPVATVETERAVEMPSEAGLPSELTHETVHDLYVEDEIVVVDVRERWEYDEGHIPGAQLIPLGELPNRFDEIPENERVVLVCERGIRSGRAQDLLLDEGVNHVHNMLGGMSAWRQAGYDIKR